MKTTKFKWIFLDIDGVLAPDGRYEDWDPQTIEELCCFDSKALSELEGVLRKYSDLKIAISSSWKEQFEYAPVKKLFSNDIQERLYGYTPVSQQLDPEWTRRNEINSFLDLRNESGAYWIAVDDLAGHFSYDKFGDQAYIVKSAWLGFTENDALLLDACLEKGLVNG